MPRMTKWIIVSFESYWTSGTLTLKPGKALTFAKSLKRNHIAFLKKLDFFGDLWIRFEDLPKGHEKLKVKFEVIYKPVVYAKRNKRV